MFCCDFTNTRCTNNSLNLHFHQEGRDGTDWRSARQQLAPRFHQHEHKQAPAPSQLVQCSGDLHNSAALGLWCSGILHSPHNLLLWTKAPGAGYQTIRVQRTLVTCTVLVLWDSGIWCFGNFRSSVILVTGYQRQNIRVPCGLVTQPILSNLVPVLRASGALLLW